MTGNKKNPTGDLRLTIGDALHIEINDGLNVSDFESYARQLPNNSSEGETSRKFHSQDFAKMLKERDDYVADLLEGYLPEKVDGLVDSLYDLLVSAKPFTVGYYAVKYMLHRKLADCFLEQGQDISAYREIYLLGATWAEAKFMTNYRDHARHGRASTAKLPQARAQRNADATFNAQQSHREWQRSADKIWLRHPTWSKMAVAVQIKKENPSIKVTPETIAKIIKSPK